MDDDECRHGLALGTCAICKPKPAPPPRPAKAAPRPGAAPRARRDTAVTAPRVAARREPELDEGNDCLVCAAFNPTGLQQCRRCGSATRAYQQAALRMRDEP